MPFTEIIKQLKNKKTKHIVILCMLCFVFLCGMVLSLIFARQLTYIWALIISGICLTAIGWLVLFYLINVLPVLSRQIKHLNEIESHNSEFITSEVVGKEDNITLLKYIVVSEIYLANGKVLYLNRNYLKDDVTINKIYSFEIKNNFVVQVRENKDE